MTKIEHLNQLLSKLKAAVMDETISMTGKTVRATDKAAIALVDAIKSNLPVHYVCNSAGDIETIAKVGMVTNTDWMNYGTADEPNHARRVELRHVKEFVEDGE